MFTEKIFVHNIPCIIWGKPSDKVYIYVHGKMGSKESALKFAEIAVKSGYQVISFDLPEHGDRKDEDYPIMVWNGVRDLNIIGRYVVNRWSRVRLYACSLGAYFSLLAYKDMPMERCLFQCPVLNMERLIEDMMKWFNVSEEELRKKREIETSMGETLYIDYYMYTKEHPVDKWDFETFVLYPSEDKLTPNEVAFEFCRRFSTHLTILEGAEHYFKEEKYLVQMESFIEKNI